LRGDKSAAFQIGWSSDNIFDAGTSLQCAQLASVALWRGSKLQLASCPRNSDKSYANAYWNAGDISIAMSFGIMNVSGLNTQLAAASSDGSLPNPSTNGEDSFENALEGLLYLDGFDEADLSSSELSQLLWAGYGCTPHITYNSRGGLTVPSAWANYYLTDKIYIVLKDGFYRYLNRVNSNLATRDHRLERLGSKDIRGDLVSSLPDLPVAPVYIILCLNKADIRTESLLEVGFAAGAMLLQATALGVGCYFNASLSEGDRTFVKSLTGIIDEPIAIVSTGYPSVDALERAIMNFGGGRMSREALDWIIDLYMEGRLRF
jgi:hypothetical protein